MTITFIATADLVDIIGEDVVRSCDTQFQNFGGITEFCGPITTIKCFQDNGLVKSTLNSPGNGGVLVVDGDSSVHTALMGDMIAAAGVKNGWAGVVILGAIRDSAVIREMEFGTKALGTNPRKSAKASAGEKDITVSFGGVDFVPGHILYADSDGIVVSEEPVEAPAE
ncbi:ribonuclease activity regulator protein RraA [Corynebacterium humireducens NBRC 106098 = DSM 45392]|uniref:4-hydroxy-4-methyl-2-oxoglutarate aldolase n=1 Tax=Corynebacterium humireducens NBRC 106098 = DSM 45392 TaxID=1223515 RepID=A0A0B5D8X0_9CORY|nr:ribonuclease E activity regulator RraA [Corynebacterium humireducens]AJE32673.1 ribonuclease activity regulator protein RraA [Corynebacterium humireducens NBRC 106098 = DSM 45392]